MKNMRIVGMVLFAMAMGCAKAGYNPPQPPVAPTNEAGKPVNVEPQVNPPVTPVIETVQKNPEPVPVEPEDFSVEPDETAEVVHEVEPVKPVKPVKPAEPVKPAKQPTKVDEAVPVPKQPKTSKAESDDAQPVTEQAKSRTERADLLTGQSRTDDVQFNNDPRQSSESVHLRLNCFLDFAPVEDSSLRGVSMKPGSHVIYERAQQNTDKYKTYVLVTCSERTQADHRKGKGKNAGTKANTHSEISKEKTETLVMKVGGTTVKKLNLAEEGEPDQFLSTTMICVISSAKVPASNQRRLILIQGSKLLLRQAGGFPYLALSCVK